MAAPLVAALIALAAALLARGEPLPEGLAGPWNLPPGLPLLVGSEARFVSQVGRVSATGPRQATGAPGPLLADIWTAKISFFGEGRLPNGTGVYLYDRPGQRNRQALTIRMDMFREGDEAYYDILSTNLPGLSRNMTVGSGDDAVCKPSAVPYIDPFDGLELAERRGSATSDGVPCTVWAFNSTDGLMRNSLCITPEGVPLELNTSANLVLGRSTRVFDGLTRLVFEVVKVGAAGEAAFANTEPCRTNFPTKPCSAQGVSVLDLYRFRSPEEPNELSNRDTADALGDMAFVCMKDADVGSNNSVVTHWRVSASRAWGQYAYCLYTGGKNVCLGGTGKQAGRESAFGMGSGHLQGQCSANDDMGSWYSFPADGRCPDGSPVGFEGCTWGDARPLRTVRASCIFHERGLLESCKQERGHAPYVRSARILEAALASNDPELGGCPDAEPHGALEFFFV